MTTSERHEATGQRFEVPEAAWGLAWLSLADQVARLLVEGPSETNSLLPSMFLGAVVVGWVSYGVLTARPIRVALVWIVLVLAGLAQVVALLDVPTIWTMVQLVVTGLQVACLLRLRQTSYYAWQQTRPRDAGANLGALVAIAITVGVLGGIIGPANDGFNLEINF